MLHHVNSTVFEGCKERIYNTTKCRVGVHGFNPHLHCCTRVERRTLIWRTHKKGEIE
jgi:hypothetical protein